MTTTAPRLYIITRKPAGAEFDDIDGESIRMPTLSNVDEQLRRGIERVAGQNPDFWTFSTNADREETNRYYQYPAMMVPRVQRALLGLVLELQPGIRTILDAFAGSGTVLSVGMSAGRDIVAQDVNPLATLVCQTKAGPFFTSILEEQAAIVVRAAGDDRCDDHDADFPGLDKWFRPQAVVELSRLRRAIRAVPELWVRRFLWVTLAETVRLTSNSRTSTYKLHIRPRSEQSAVPLPLATFGRLIRRNIDRHAKFASALAESQYVVENKYISSVDCRLGDSRQPFVGTFDLLMTSPPYGDNTSTVPYGQSSYLPLQWIDLHDIDDAATEDYLRSTYEIDTRSLGGRRPRGDIQLLAADLCKRSPSLDATMLALASEPRDRMARVYTFVRDLESCLAGVVASLRDNAYLIWTVGNRRVGGVQIPLDAILTELLALHQVVEVTSLERRIQAKRMANRNPVAATMRLERVLIFRRQPTSGRRVKRVLASPGNASDLISE